MDDEIANLLKKIMVGVSAITGNNYLTIGEAIEGLLKTAILIFTLL